MFGSMRFKELSIVELEEGLEVEKEGLVEED